MAAATVPPPAVGSGPAFGHTARHALSPWAAFAHGAFLTLLDGLGLGLPMPPSHAAALRAACIAILRAQLPACEAAAIDEAALVQPPEALADAGSMPPGLFGCAPFFVPLARSRPPPK